VVKNHNYSKFTWQKKPEKKTKILDGNLM